MNPKLKEALQEPLVKRQVDLEQPPELTDEELDLIGGGGGEMDSANCCLGIRG